MILLSIAAVIFSGCAPKWTAHTDYFILNYKNGHTSVIACSEEAFINFSPKVETQVGKVRVDYSEDGAFQAAFDWLRPPDGNVIRIAVGNVVESGHSAFLAYEAKCRGVSVNADLNHIYTSKKVCYTGQNNSKNPVMEVVDIAVSEILYAIDFSRISLCPYYAEPAISVGLFSEHSVFWNQLQFTCSGNLRDPNEKLFFEIYM